MKYPNHYISILKCKAGELNALKAIDISVRQNLTPMLCIQPIPLKYPKDGEPFPAKTLEKHLGDTAEAVGEVWNDGPPVFIDFDIHPDQMVSKTLHYATCFFNNLTEQNIKFIPVYGPDREGDQKFTEAVKLAAKNPNSELCIRLGWQDIELFRDISEKVENILQEFSVTRERTHLVLDLRTIEAADIPSKASTVASAINNISNVNAFASLTVASAGIPKDMSQFKTNTESVHERNDLQFWLHILNLELNRKPLFSDYCIVNPDASEVDPRVMNRSARIRYTSDKGWIIIKGSSYKKIPAKTQNHELAQKMTQHKDFMGAQYSAGDDFIDRCANRKIGPGSPTNWVAAESNHHITHVVNQLAKMNG